jgi:hypothetical protein
MVNATNMRVDPHTSHEAGIASHKGLMFVLSCNFDAAWPPGDRSCYSCAFLRSRKFLMNKKEKTISSPMNITAVWM